MEQAPDILGQLKGVRRCSDGWIARCPAHEDRRPSLSISVRDGKLLLHCHAGCTFGAILAALSGPSGIGRTGNMAMAKEKHEKRTARSAAEWKVITDRAFRAGERQGLTAWLARNLGLPLPAVQGFGVGWSQERSAYTIPMWNVRNEIIGIQLRKHDGTRLCIPGSRLGLFLPSYFARLRPPAALLVCEGMTDAAAAAAMGFAAIGRPSATSGTPLVVQYAERFAAAYTIIADNDVAGLLGAWKLIKRLSCARLPIPYRLIWPPWPHKDLRAWYAADPSGASQTLGKYLM